MRRIKTLVYLPFFNKMTLNSNTLEYIESYGL